MLTLLNRCRMLLACTALAGLVGGVGLGAQEAAAPPNFPVRGVVLNRITRQPVARALVDAQTDAVLTDGEGRFELSLPAQMTQISVRRPGYQARGQDSVHMVGVGPDMPELTFYLTPQAGITGHVTLSTGDDADGIRFTAYRLEVSDGREHWRTVEQVTTNSEGTLRLANLDAPGSYVLCSMAALDRGAPAARGAVRYGYPSVCFPGPMAAGATGTTANVLVATPGQQVEVELPLTRQAFYPVTIAVPNAGRGQGVGVRIHDPNGRALEFNTRWDEQRGVGEVNLPNGQYYAEADVYGQARNYGRVDFRVANAPVSGLSMTLLPLRPIAVQVRKEFTEPVAEDRLRAQSGQENGPPLNLNLTSADSTVDGGGGGGLEAIPGANDNTTFQIRAMIPGRYWVRPFPFEGYVSSMTSGGVDLTREPLLIGPGDSVSPVLITLRNDSGQIECTVNQPAGGAGAQGQAVGEQRFSFVYAIPVGRLPSQIQPALMRGPGQTVIPNLAPGTYRVVAFDSYREVDLSDPKTVARLAEQGKTVAVTAGGTTAVQLDLIHVGGADSAGPEAQGESDL